MRDWLMYPGLSRQDWGLRLRWWRKPAIFVLHSTEGSGYPGYGGGKSAPHFTVHCRARTSRQHAPLSSAARALKTSILGQTNRGGAIQFEIIGTCDPRMGGIPSVLNLDDGDLRYLAGLLEEVAAETGVPLSTSVVWSPYPASYGGWRGRLGWLAWFRHRGVVGHQHVPGNSHGDPGALNVRRLLELANPPTKDWFDMATKADLITAVREALGDDVKEARVQATHAAGRIATLRNVLLYEFGGSFSNKWDSSKFEDRVVEKVLKRVVPAVVEQLLPAITAAVLEARTPPPQP